MVFPGVMRYLMPVRAWSRHQTSTVPMFTTPHARAYWITRRYRVAPVGWWSTMAYRVFLAGLWLVTVGNSVVMAGIGVVTG